MDKPNTTSNPPMDVGVEDITHDDLVSSLTELVDDNNMVSADTTREVKEETKTETKEVTEEASDDDYLADVGSEDEVEVDDEPEAEAEETEEAEADDVDNTIHTVKYNGEDIEVTLDELKKGYTMQSDYTKKTQKLAEERKAIEDESKTLDYLKVQKELQPEVLRLEGLQEQIAIAEEAVHTGMEVLPDGTTRKLSDEAIKATEDNINKAKRELNFGKKKLDEQLADYVPPKLDELKEKLPKLFSEKSEDRNEVLSAHRDVLENIGYTNVEINSVNDPRLILLIQEVVEGRNLAKQVEAAKARKKNHKGSVVNKTTKSGTPRTNKSTRKPNEGTPKDYTAMADKIHSGENISMEDYLGDVL